KRSKTKQNMLANQSKELKDFANRMIMLRKWSFIAMLLHICVTLVVMAMGFSTGGDDNRPSHLNDSPLYMSPTIVVCAFGCLNTCVFACAEWSSIADGTRDTARGKMPSWTWHNSGLSVPCLLSSCLPHMLCVSGFLQAVGNVFFLSLFMLPALVVFMLHSL